MIARSFSVTRQIAAPPEKVWSLLTDAGSYNSWNKSVLSITGEMSPGSTIELVSIANPKRTFRLKVAEATPPAANGLGRMVWADGMPLGLFKGERTYVLEPNSNGTRFSMSEIFTGPLAGLITKAIPDMTQSFELFADGLKRGAESARP